MNEVKSAKRVLDVVELLSQETGGVSLKQIGQALDIPPSSCHALLETLWSRGYVVRDGETLAYRLSSKLFGLAAAHLDGLDLVRVAEPVMAQMTQLCGHAVSLAILEGTEVVFVHKKMATGVIQIVNPVGTRLPAHATALGKVILAEMPRQTVEVLYANTPLKPSTRNTITSLDELMRCLDEVKASGVAYDWEESSEGLQAVGAGIKNAQALSAAAISIAVPKVQEYAPAFWRRLERLVKGGAHQISERLGYPQPLDAAETSLAELWGA